MNEYEVKMEVAKAVINDYCQSEFEQDADFSNMKSIGLAFTTLTDDEIPIQVSLDLKNMKLKTWLGCEDEDDDCLVESKDITLDTIINEGFDFDSLISGWQSYIENHPEKYAA